MPMDPLEQFFTAGDRKRGELLKNPDIAKAVQAHLGPDAYSEYLGIAKKRSATALGEGPPNLLFVPGVMGSVLKSGVGGIWWIDVRSIKRVDSLALSDDGQTDKDRKFRIEPVAVDCDYESFLLQVASSDRYSHETFPYDWRKNLRLSAQLFRDRVLDCRKRNGGKPVHLVAHSMGGLMVRTGLMCHPELWDAVGRIVFLATPHYGSPAIAGYLKNHLWGLELLAVLGAFISRATLRSMRGVIGLLPAPAGYYPGTRGGKGTGAASPPSGAAGVYEHPCVNFNLYDAGAWNLDFESDEEANSQLKVLQGGLDAAQTLHRDLYQHHQSLKRDQLERMLVIAGVGYKTLFRLAYRDNMLWSYMVKETSRDSKDLNREGDGRVPLASASLENVHIRYVKGEHSALPSIPDVQRDVFHWLDGNTGKMSLPTSVQGALASSLAGPAGGATPHLDGSALKPAVGDDPGYLRFDLEPGAVARLKEQAEQGQLPELSRMRLL